MPPVLPPEWDSMSANEQLIWYLARLTAKMEGMTAELMAACGGEPPMATPQADPAASSALCPEPAVPHQPSLDATDNVAAVLTTAAYSAAAPTMERLHPVHLGVSSSGAQAQEVPEVIHDASPTYIARAPVTCSTDGSTQAIAGANVDEVHDATTTVRLEPVVDLNDKEVEQPFPAPATASSTAASAMPGALASTTAIECQEGLAAVHDTSTESITVASMTCSTICSNQVIAALSLTSPITPTPPLPATTLTFVTDSDSILRVPQAMGVLVLTQAPRVVPVMYLLQLFADRDISYQTLVLRPTPWPSFLVYQADEKVIRPMSWPPFPCSPEGVTLKHRGVLPQVTYVMNYLTGNLNSLRASSRYLASLQLKPCLFEKVACWIPPIPIDIQVPAILWISCSGCTTTVCVQSRDHPAEATLAIIFLQLPNSTAVTNQTVRSILFREESLHSDLLSNKLHGCLPESLYNRTTSLPAYQTLLWFGDLFHFPGCISISAACNRSSTRCNKLLAHVYVSSALHCPWDPGDEQCNSRCVSTQYDHAWMCSAEQHDIISVSDTSQVAFSTAGAPVHSCAAAKQDHCHLDCVRAICAQDHCHLDVKDFYELSSTNGCLTSELPVWNVSSELLLFLACPLDISNTQLDAYNSMCFLFWLCSASPLTCDICMLESDLHLYQRGCSWDPGGLALQFRRNLRTNSEFLHITGVLSELTQFWVATQDISTSSFGTHLVGTLLIMIKLEQCTETISYIIQPGLHLLCMSTTSRALLVLQLEWPLFPCTNFLVGNLAAYPNSCAVNAPGDYSDQHPFLQSDVQTPIRCLIECLIHVDGWVQHIPALSNFSQVCMLSNIVFLDPAVSVRHPFLTARAEHIIHLMSKCMVVVKLLVHSIGQLIDKVHKWKRQYKALESNGFNCSCCICFGIPLAEGVKLKSEGVQSNEQCTMKLVLPALSSCEQWGPGGLNFADVPSLPVPCSSTRLVDCALHML